MAQALLPPGFRFHPTDEELVSYFLKRKVMGKILRFMAISEVEIYKFAPWDLPEKSCMRTKDLEWYFYCPRDKKYPNGSRVNRSTEIGYWKTTGKDRTILHDSRIVGMKKSLIFHTGKPPKGDRTDWVMYEYRLTDDQLAAAGVAQDSYVICKIFKKSGMGPKIGEQYGAPFSEEDWEDDANFEATLAAFPFLPHQQPTAQLSNINNATTSTMEPVPMSVDATTIIETVPDSVAATTTLEPAPLSPLATESVVVQSAAIRTGGYEELPEITGPLFGMLQFGAAIPDSPEMDGIQLDDLADLLLDSPYRPGDVSDQLALQQSSPAVVNNKAANSETNGIYNELADLLDGVPSIDNELASLGSTLATNDNVAQPLLSELGAEHFVELNDIVFDQEENFLDYYDPTLSPQMEVDAIFSMGHATSEPLSGGLTSDSDWRRHH